MSVVIYTSGLAYEGEKIDPWLYSVWPIFFERLVNNFPSGTVIHFDPEWEYTEPSQNGEWRQLFLKEELPVEKPYDATFLFDFANAGTMWPQESSFYPRHMFCENWVDFYRIVEPFKISDNRIISLREMEKKLNMHVMGITSYPRNFMANIMEYTLSPQSILFEIIYNDLKDYDIFDLPEEHYETKVVKGICEEFNKMIWEFRYGFNSYYDFFIDIIELISTNHLLAVINDNINRAKEAINKREKCNFNTGDQMGQFLKNTHDSCINFSNNEEIMAIYFYFEEYLNMKCIFNG